MVGEDRIPDGPIPTGHSDHANTVLTVGRGEGGEREGRGREGRERGNIVLEMLLATYSAGETTNLSGKNSFTPFWIKSAMVVVYETRRSSVFR